MGRCQLPQPYRYHLSNEVVNNLMRNYGIGPEQVGRLEIGT